MHLKDIMFIDKTVYRRNNLFMSRATLQQRKKALSNAIASVKMEGYFVFEYERKLCMEVLNGEMTKDNFIKTMLSRCKP